MVSLGVALKSSKPVQTDLVLVRVPLRLAFRGSRRDGDSEHECCKAVRDAADVAGEIDLAARQIRTRALGDVHPVESAEFEVVPAAIHRHVV